MSDKILGEMEAWVMCNSREKNLCFSGANGSTEYLLGEPLASVITKRNSGVPIISIIVSRMQVDYEHYVERPLEVLYQPKLICIGKLPNAYGDPYECLILDKEKNNENDILNMLYSEEINREPGSWMFKDFNKVIDKLSSLYSDDEID